MEILKNEETNETYLLMSGHKNWRKVADDEKLRHEIVDFDLLPKMDAKTQAKCDKLCELIAVDVAEQNEMIEFFFKKWPIVRPLENSELGVNPNLEIADFSYCINDLEEEIFSNCHKLDAIFEKLSA